MQSPEELEREHQVVDEVMSALGAHPQVSVCLLGRPDEERGSGRFPEGLTVDAVLELSTADASQLWAVDVTILGWNPRLVPARRDFEPRLVEALRPLAVEAGMGLAVMYRPPVGAPDRGRAYLDLIVDFTERLLVGQEEEYSPTSLHPLHQDEDTAVLLDPDHPGVVDIMSGLSDTPDSLGQLSGTFEVTLRKKLTGQLLRAHEHGYRTLLAVDQVGPPNALGTNFIASPTTVGQSVGRTVADHGHQGGAHALDLAVLVTVDSCVPVFGYWPGAVTA